MAVQAYLSTLCVILSVLGATDHGSGSQEGHSGNRGGGSLGAKQGAKVPVHLMKWRVLERPGEGRVRIGNMVGWCPDLKLDTGPRIRGVKQIDRSRAVILKVYVAQTGTQHCGPVEAPVEVVVHIRHGLKGRALYDGSASPPIRRWPR